MGDAIKSKRVTYDFARALDGSTQVSCSEFGNVIDRQYVNHTAPVL
ncbi:hypothetical protein OURE66S_03136 [Oligella ureolytica]